MAKKKTPKVSYTLRKRPKTDEEARQTCINCRRRKDKDHCSLEEIGLITVQSRHACWLAGYSDFVFPNDYSETRKLPKYPPCP